MNSEQGHLSSEPKDDIRHFDRLKVAAAVATVSGIVLFAYFVYSVGVGDLWDGISRFGSLGFLVILSIYFVRVCARAYAWKLSVHGPYELSVKDTFPAVVIGEALSSTIPLGILISGTSKAIAVRRRIPLVAGLSSVATENLFYSFITGLFLIGGAVVLLRGFPVDENIVYALNFLVVTLAILTVLGVAMVIRQWHLASETLEFLFRQGIAVRLLEKLRLDARLFENLIYGFYRRHPGRFVPICLLELLYHILGVAEVWYILSRLGEGLPSLTSAFLLESVSRLITVMFKLIPFMIGVDEAGAELVGEAVAIGAGVGVTLAIIRKGRILFWTAIGMLLVLNRGISIREIFKVAKRSEPI